MSAAPATTMEAFMRIQRTMASAALAGGLVLTPILAACAGEADEVEQEVEEGVNEVEEEIEDEG